MFNVALLMVSVFNDLRRCRDLNPKEVNYINGVVVVNERFCAEYLNERDNQLELQL